MTRLETLTHDLLVELVENLQTQYDEGNFISQDVVHQTASEVLEEHTELLTLIGDDEDERIDFLLDDVIGNIALNL